MFKVASSKLNDYGKGGNKLNHVLFSKIFMVIIIFSAILAGLLEMYGFDPYSSIMLGLDTVL